MTLNSLILFAAVYFAAVATPGPGVATATKYTAAKRMRELKVMSVAWAFAAPRR